MQLKFHSKIFIQIAQFILTRVLVISSLTIFLFVFYATISFAQYQKDLLNSKTRDLLHEALSGELAKDHVIQISRHHRIQGSRGYRDAAQYVLEQLRQTGFSEKDAYIESFKSDGKVHYQTWQSPSGWDIESAELRMLEPYDERIVGYPEVAMSLVTYSNPGEATAELVWVGSGASDSDYSGKNVRGKFVLATGYGGSVHRLAVLKYGAKAVVCYLDDDRASEYPDMLAYTGMWPLPDELDGVTFGFNLSNRQGEKLKQLLESGKKVVMHGKVAGIGLESYFMDIPVAHIRGSEFPDEELVFSAHLDHPKESANDNGSGSAALLDIAQSLKNLIDSGRLPQPKRSMRFIWVPEWNGTMAYIDKHPEMVGPALGGKFLASINMDMVGEHLELIHTKMSLTRTPDSMPSVVNDVIENMTQMVDKMNVRTPRGSLSAFNYRITPYSGGSDHMMFIDRKISGIMIGHGDYTHHTSEDTPDKVDPVELERSEIIAAAAMLYLASLDPDEALDLTYLTSANSAGRLGDALRRATAQLEKATNGTVATAWSEGQNILDHALQRESATIGSILDFNNHTSVKTNVNKMQQELHRQHQYYTMLLHDAANSQGAAAKTPPVLNDKPDKRIPVRTTRGPLDFDLPESKLSEEEKAWYAKSEFRLSGTVRFELVNFIDGEKTVTDIRNALSAEFDPVDLKVVSHYLDDLVKVGVMKWK